MTKNTQYQTAINDVAESMHEIIREVEVDDPSLTMIEWLDSGQLKAHHGERIVEIDQRVAQIIQQFNMDADDVESDIAETIQMIDHLHLPFVGNKQYTVH